MIDYADNVQNVTLHLHLTIERKNVTNVTLSGKKEKKCQPSGAGGTRSPPTTPHRLQHLTACLIQNGQQGLEIG